MDPQSSTFSPQAVIERLTGEQILEATTRASPAEPNRQVIRILRLKGAVNDASLFKSYLVDDLLVPETQVTCLFDTQATRAEIIRGFQDLATNPNIKRDDPIVIYYAGHGAEIRPPPSRRDINGAFIQSLVPQDAGSRGLSASEIPPIPDFTIGSLLNRIANAKGNNITVIFDSCHSASVTRIHVGGRSRSIPSVSFDPLPEDIDSEIVTQDSMITTRSLRRPQDQVNIQGMQSHVLLAACGSKEVAYEDSDTVPHHGYFTKALLEVFRSVGPTRLTYKSCIQRLPKLEAFGRQNPVCEGANVDRMLFDGKVSGADKSFILLEEKEGKIYLRAGAAHGVTPGCVFAIHADLILDSMNPPLGTMVVDQVTPFQSLLKFSEENSGFIIPQPAYGRQTGTGNQHAFDIYFTPEFEKAISPSPQWKIAFSGGENDIVLRLVQKNLATLIVDVDAAGEATFTFPRFGLAVKNGVAKLRRTIWPNFGSVYRVMSAAARFSWHLERFPQSRPFQAAVKMEFYKLRESGQYDETGGFILEVDGLDLNERGRARVTVDSKDRYAFRIVNTTSQDLYAYLFRFSLSTLEIRAEYVQVIGSGLVDPSLPKKGSLTLGYGSGGVKPFQFNMTPGETIEVGVFKLFLSTSPIDLSSVEQEPPFGIIESRRLVTADQVKHHLGVFDVGTWDAITMDVELIRPPEDPSSDKGFGSQIIDPTLTESGTLASEIASPLAGLIPEKQHTLAQDVKVTHGLVIDPNCSPRFSDRPVSLLLRPAAEVFSVHNTTTVEENTSSSMLDAELTHVGLPHLSHMSHLSLLDNFPVSNDESQLWITRRIISAKLNFTASPQDFQPESNFVSDIRDALGRPKDWQKFEGLKDAFKTWGMIIPLSGIIGYSSVATSFNRIPNWPRPPATRGLEPDDSKKWRIVKVTRVASILELLEDGLQGQIKQLYAGLIFRSPCVGMHQMFGFDGVMNQNRRIREIEIGFSDVRIERITIHYDGGVVAGPHGTSGTPSQSSRFETLAQMGTDGGITDILVWATDEKISSIQLLEGDGRASPIYGATQGLAQGPKLISGDGCTLVGLSGGYGTLGITQLQAIWRGDTHVKGHRCKQISHVGGNDGILWSDSISLGRQPYSRIYSITARAPGTGVLGDLQTTYESFVDGDYTSQTTSIHGTERGPTVTWDLKGELITRVRGRHDGKSICELQFITHRENSSPAFGQPVGDYTFNIEGPEISDGWGMSRMVLHHMAGTSNEFVNSLLFVWAEPFEGGTLSVWRSSPPKKEDPQANVFNLCRKQESRAENIMSFGDYSEAGAITRSISVKPSLHALIIGINKYESNAHLAAAVPDALNFKQYLADNLLVPETQIKLLLDKQASRNNILKALQDLAREDNGIERNEAIVIYYAGYGGEIEALSDHSLVQCIIPQDVSIAEGIAPIPHFIIGALVRAIAQEKGSNITLIFDCCYSAGGFRDDSTAHARYISAKDLPPLSELPDCIIDQDNRSDAKDIEPITSGLSFSALDNYVVIAACGDGGVVFENRDEGYGYFTQALLNVLRSVEVDSVTYKGLIQRLRALQISQTQNPICKGKDIDRILFKAQVQSANATFIPIERKQDGFYLHVGLVKGVTPGSKYAVHPGDIFGPHDTVIGTVEVGDVGPFVARVKDSSDLHELCYARLMEYGPDRSLGVHVTEAFVTAAEPSDLWTHAFSGGEEDIVLCSALPELAQVVLSVNKQNETTFTLTNPVSVKHGIETLPPPGKSPVPPSAHHITPVLSALAKWSWYLGHIPTTPPLRRFIDMELYKLQPTGEYTNEGNSIYGPEGEDWVVGGEVNMVGNTKDLFGIKIMNRSDTDLYAYLFSFSPTTLAIKHIPTDDLSSQGALLPKSQSLSIGYGSDRQSPLTFPLHETQDADAAILRLFVSTDPADFGGMEQESPFDGNGAFSRSGVKDLFKKEALWDVVGVNVVFRSSPKVDETIIRPILKPIGGLTMIPASESDIVPIPDAGTIPELDAGIMPTLGAGITPIPDAGIMPLLRPAITPGSGDGIIPISEPGIISTQGPSITPIVEPGITPVLEAGVRPTPMPLTTFPPTMAGDTKPSVRPTGALFTGRSSLPLQVRSRTLAPTSEPWFRTPTLTPEVLTSIRCMRLRTLARERGPDGANSSAAAGGYFEVSVLASDGLPKVLANNIEVIYYSHKASQSTEWTDGMIFEKEHEIWETLEVGDCFEVSVCAKGRGWVCEAEMGNLIFW